MALASLTFKEIKAQPVICKLTRPAVARIGTMTHLPIILIDLFTEEGVVGCGTVPESRAELNALYFAALERLTVEDWRRASQ
jgi:mandelate racemase